MDGDVGRQHGDAKQDTGDVRGDFAVILADQIQDQGAAMGNGFGLGVRADGADGDPGGEEVKKADEQDRDIAGERDAADRVGGFL